MLNKIINILYTHTDYSDVWPLYFGQQKKYFDVFSNNVIFVNQPAEGIPNNWRQVIYNDQQSYTDRLIGCFSQISSSEVCFFSHEDMFLYDFPKTDKVYRYADTMFNKSGVFLKQNQFDFIKMIKGGDFNCKKTTIDETLFSLCLDSKWLFSIQPSFWNIQKFIELLTYHRGNTIWEFEEKAQKTCKKMKIKGGHSDSGGKKVGMYHWENEIYPYIATAIVKGRWNFSEYRHVLTPILAEYNIQASIRGIV